MGGQPDVCEIAITAPSVQWMDDFVRELIAEKLVAAVHLFEPVRSIYRWNGVVREEVEIRAAFHTRASLAPHVLERLHATHPFQVPGMVVLPIEGGNPDYLAWIYSETQGSD
ncbi:hypothetical protein FDG2_1918 [Candidatus Protofrankia californiensis]|uniref:CutA1 divalent ion tolerance protein n=1 Tax=Candidatus Protofrankia californiensis TaxID=1839754 RepID=A0A1C3NWP8_9ACTN|nr:hypothetical protein FDG2_1918 [Candidatus Protofrankia californiensis]